MSNVFETNFVLNSKKRIDKKYPTQNLFSYGEKKRRIFVVKIKQKLS